jgi:serine protein kinase
VTRNAFQRVYDMIIAAGVEEYVDNKKKLREVQLLPRRLGPRPRRGLRPRHPLMRLVNVLKAAAEGYGPERRVILLHGPVGRRRAPSRGSSRRAWRSTPAPPRARSTRTPGSTSPARGLVSGKDDTTFPSPMNEEPLLLIPRGVARAKAIQALGLGNDRIKVAPEGDLNPACRYIFNT